MTWGVKVKDKSGTEFLASYSWRGVGNWSCPKSAIPAPLGGYTTANYETRAEARIRAKLLRGHGITASVVKLRVIVEVDDAG